MDRRTFLRDSSSGVATIAAAGAIPGKVLGANDRIRIGLIGCGGRGNFLLSQIQRQAAAHNVEVAALCDVWTVNLERTAAVVTGWQGSAPRQFRRYGDLLAMRDLDAVIIATPDFAHTPILCDAARNRKDAYVEKPMATVLDHANDALRLVAQARTVVQVGCQRRSDARHRAGAELIQSGILGKVSQVDAAWHDAAPRWARDVSNVRQQDVDWEQYLMFLPRTPFNAERFRRWHFFKDYTQGTPALLGAHLIDVGLWFMDDPLPKSAVAHGGVYAWKDGREHADTIVCALEYPKEFVLQYSTRLGNNSPVPEVQFYGTKGTFDTRTWTARGEGGGADKLQAPVTVPPAAAPAAVASNGGGSATNGLAAQNDPRLSGDEHMVNWLECLRSRATPNAPVDVGYAHSVASMLCYQAWSTGRRQVFDPVARTIRPG